MLAISARDMAFSKKIERSLARLSELNQVRERRVLQSAQNTSATLLNKSVLNFTSNDYLGVANHPRLKEALIEGAEQYGCGSGASQMISGFTDAHERLENKLTEFLDCEAVISLSNGYMANLALLSSLLDKDCHVFLDKLSHASLIDGVKLSDAKWRRFPHLDSSKLELMLNKTSENAMVVTDGLFSMDGDCADIASLAELSKNHSAHLHVDDAHGIGVYGARGRGTLEKANININAIGSLTGTFGKAFGSYGAFIAGAKSLIEYIKQWARPFIFTTALPPAIAYASEASIDIVQTETWRRDELHSLINYFRGHVQSSKLPFLDSVSPIQPLIIGSNHKAVALADYLQTKNILAHAVRPPSVRPNSARIRITLSASHTKQDIDKLFTHLTKWFQTNLVSL